MNTNASMTITDLANGQTATLKNLGKDPGLHLRLLSLGLLPGDPVTILNKVPFRGPISIKHGTKNYFALRYREASTIEVELS